MHPEGQIGSPTSIFGRFMFEMSIQTQETNPSISLTVFTLKWGPGLGPGREWTQDTGRCHGTGCRTGHGTGHGTGQGTRDGIPDGTSEKVAFIGDGFHRGHLYGYVCRHPIHHYGCGPPLLWRRPKAASIVVNGNAANIAIQVIPDESHPQ